MADYETLLAETSGPPAPPGGLAAIAAEFKAGAGPVMAAARGSATLDGGQAGHERKDGALVSPDDVWPLYMPVGQLTGAGTIDEQVVGTDWGPPTGWAWRITEVTIILPTGTSLVQIYRESAQGLGSLRFQTGVSTLWEPSRMFLMNGQRLVAVSTGGGCTIAPDGERIRLSFLATYMA